MTRETADRSPTSAKSAAGFGMTVRYDVHYSLG
jgi:hypothetical protein